MTTFNSRSDLKAAGATMIAEASSQHVYEFESDLWTELSLWWLDTLDKPFIAVVEGKVSEDAPGDMVNRFRSVQAGTLDRAIGWFDPTDLRDDLVENIPADARDIFVDANTLRARKAQERRGYPGPDDFGQAIAWLYEGKDLSASAMAKAFERDFGVPWRTVYNAMKGQGTGWMTGIVRALRYFDRGAWRAKHKEMVDG